MPLRRFILVLALLATTGLTACKPKKPPVPPPQAQAPTMTQPLPPVIVPVPEAQPPETSTKPEDANPTPPPEPKPKTRPRPAGGRKTDQPASKPAESTTANADRPAAPAPAPPRPTTPPVNSGLVVPALPHDQAIHDRMTTEVLLQSTEQNLASLRGLSSTQQSQVQQIRVYMQYARGAIEDGDNVRARVLAMKAHLLSDELVQH